MKLNKTVITPTCKCCNLPFSDKIGFDICDCGFFSCEKCKHCDTHCKCNNKQDKLVDLKLNICPGEK